MPLQLSLKKRESWPQRLREKCPTPMRLCTVMGLWPFCCRRGPRDGFITTTASVAAPYLFVSRLAWKVLGCYAAFELLLIRVLPGQMQSGPPSPTGHVLCTHGVLRRTRHVRTAHVPWRVDPGLVYDHLGEILGALNISAVVLCWLLYFKGKYLPSNSDASVSGNLIFDYYWGTELYPRVLGKSIRTGGSCHCSSMVAFVGYF